MSYQEQLSEILSGIDPAFTILCEYVFQGEGDPSSVATAFVEAYEEYQKARTLTLENFGSAEIDLEEGQTLCNPTGGRFGGDNPQMDAAYHMARQTGMLPPPLMEMLPDFIMDMNHFFIAAKNL